MVYWEAGEAADLEELVLQFVMHIVNIGLSAFVRGKKLPSRLAFFEVIN